MIFIIIAAILFVLCFVSWLLIKTSPIYQHKVAITRKSLKELSGFFAVFFGTIFCFLLLCTVLVNSQDERILRAQDKIEIEMYLEKFSNPSTVEDMKIFIKYYDKAIKHNKYVYNCKDKQTNIWYGVFIYSKDIHDNFENYIIDLKK